MHKCMLDEVKNKIDITLNFKGKKLWSYVHISLDSQSTIGRYCLPDNILLTSTRNVKQNSYNITLLIH